MSDVSPQPRAAASVMRTQSSVRPSAQSGFSFSYPIPLALSFIYKVCLLARVHTLTRRQTSPPPNCTQVITMVE